MAMLESQIQVGGDPRGFSEFAALRDELAKLSHPACPDVDWDKVEQLCLTLFHKNGADLQTAAFYALARSHRHGLAGLTEGVALMRALVHEWADLWPSAVSVRLGIMSWLFAQLQLVLRSLEIKLWNVPAFIHLNDELAHVHQLLERRAQAPLVTLSALRQLVHNLQRRAGQEGSSHAITLQSTNMSVPTFVAPVIILQSSRLPDTPPARISSSRRRVAAWSLAMASMFALAGWFAGSNWLSAQKRDGEFELGGIFNQQSIPKPVSLNSLSLFKPGSAEFKPDSTRILINALMGIKAQPGWLIVIAGHTDVTGNTEQNLKLSHARAVAVRDWLQSISEMPASCFAIQGFGATQPIADNHTATGRAANRRVDIRLVPQVGACG